MPGFHFPDIRQSRRLLRTCSVAAGVSARRIHNCRSLMLLLDQLRKIRSHFDVIVGMSNNDQHIHFVSRVRRRIRLRLLLRSHCLYCEQRDCPQTHNIPQFHRECVSQIEIARLTAYAEARRTACSPQGISSAQLSLR